MASAASPPDVIRAVQSYINKILRPKDPAKAISGMRCLLLDASTKTAVSMAYSMHDVLSRDVYLVEDVAAAAALSNLGHLAAIVVVRPTAENVRALLGHLKEPRFREYHIFFTNIVTQDLLRKLADADHTQVVKQVQEFYIDYFPINTDLFSLNLGGSLSLSRPRSSYSVHEAAAFTRTSQGLLAALLALKLKPYVRYHGASEVASALAREVTGTMSGERDLFTFQRGAAAPPLLLVLDRREDPVTPLLTQWTYQAMVHELMPGGIKANTVDLRGVKGVSKDLECVCSCAASRGRPGRASRVDGGARARQVFPHPSPHRPRPVPQASGPVRDAGRLLPRAQGRQLRRPGRRGAHDAGRLRRVARYEEARRGVGHCLPRRGSCVGRVACGSATRVACDCDWRRCGLLCSGMRLACGWRHSSRESTADAH